jgi:hypothetical protein
VLKSLSNDEIESIISALTSKEYFLSVGEKEREARVANAASERMKYSQGFSPSVCHSDSWYTTAFDLQVSRPKLTQLISIEEESAELAELLDNLGDWNFDTI